MKKVAVAMSGGLDSSFAAWLLKKRGYDVTGITLRLGPPQGDSARGPGTQCCSVKQLELARGTALKLGIPHYVWDYTKDFDERVIRYFFDTYLAGRTPNPCVECNRWIKFEKLLKNIRVLGFDYLATGHYARITRSSSGYALKKARDKTRDQSYFLYPVKKEYLPFILFPNGAYTKSDIRTRARELGLPSASAPESREICFVEDKRYQELFVRARKLNPGPIRDSAGARIGTHKGLALYTIGQRKGMGIARKDPVYVIKIDYKNNTLIVGDKKEVYGRECSVQDINWLVKPETLKRKRIKVRIRYQHREDSARISFLSPREVRVEFLRPQLAITPGQSAVFYSGEQVLGGGIIAR